MLSWTQETNGIITTSYSDSGSVFRSYSASELNSAVNIEEIDFGELNSCGTRKVRSKGISQESYSAMYSYSHYYDTIYSYEEESQAESYTRTETVQQYTESDNYGSSTGRYKEGRTIKETQYGSKSNSYSTLISQTGATSTKNIVIYSYTLAFRSGKAATTTKTQSEVDIKTTTTQSTDSQIFDISFSYENTITTWTKIKKDITTYTEKDSTYQYPNQPAATIYRRQGNEKFFTAEVSTSENFENIPKDVTFFTDIFKIAEDEQITAVPIVLHDQNITKQRIAGYNTASKVISLTNTISWNVQFDTLTDGKQQVGGYWKWTDAGDENENVPQLNFPLGLSYLTFTTKYSSFKKTNDSYSETYKFTYYKETEHGFSKRNQLTTMVSTYKDTYLKSGTNPFNDYIKKTITYIISKITTKRNNADIIYIESSSYLTRTGWDDKNNDLETYTYCGKEVQFQRADQNKYTFIDFSTATMDAAGNYTYNIPVASTPTIIGCSPNFILFESSNKIGVYDDGQIKQQIVCNRSENIDAIGGYCQAVGFAARPGAVTYSIIHNKQVVSLIEKSKGILDTYRDSTANVSFNNKSMFIFNNFKNTTNYILSTTVSYNVIGQAGRNGEDDFNNVPNIIGGSVMRELDGFGIWGCAGLNNYFLSNKKITKFDFPTYESFKYKQTFLTDGFIGASINLRYEPGTVPDIVVCGVNKNSVTQY